MRTIAVFNQKGGCGKTTTAINLAACLAEAGKKTLLVDLDGQGHSTMGCNVHAEDVEVSTFECLAGPQEGCRQLNLAEIAWEIFPNMFLAPGSIMLSAFEQKLAGVEGRERRLADGLAEIKGEFDWTVLDCGPAMGLLSVNAIVAADIVVIPVETGFFSLKSVDRTRETVKLVGQRTGHRPHLIILPTMYDPRTKSDREAFRRLKNQFDGLLSDTTIRFNAKLKEAAGKGSPITEYFPGCRGHHDYQALAQELMALSFQLTLNDDRAEATDSLATQSAEVAELSQQVLGATVVTDGVLFMARAPGAQSVRLAGSFNDWDPRSCEMETDQEQPYTWRKLLPLNEGRHEYRLVIDGNWAADPANPHASQNEFGDFNSVIVVER